MKKTIEFIRSLGSGGAETLVKDYALHFDNVKVVTYYKTDKTANEEQLTRAKKEFICLNQKNAPKIFRWTIGVFITAFKLRRYVRENDVEVIHAHLDVAKMLYISRKAFRNVKLIYTVHTEPKRLFENSLSGKIEKYCVQKLIQENKMQMVSLHDEMRQEVNQMYEIENTLIVYNGIDLARFNKNLYQKQDILVSLGLDKSDYIVGHVGRMIALKNHQFLLDVFLNVLTQKPNAKLLLIGTGPLKTDIMARIQQENIVDKVLILENRSDIPQLMTVMDVFVFPSIQEGLPVTLVEAQAMGLKCVVSSNVTSAVHLTTTYQALELSEGAERWSQAVLDFNKKTVPVNDLSDFDMKKVVKQLETIYS